MDDFVDRKVELARLEGMWREAQAQGPRLVVCYGRRRIGKTTLLWHFAQGKPHVFHFATRQGETTEVQRITDAIRRSLGSSALDGVGRLTSWEEVLRFVARASEDRPLLVVIDEMPYLLEGAPGFATAVQAVWDEVGLVRRARLMLVLTGSARRVIQGALAGSGPLYGRPDLRLLVEPVGLAAARAFMPGVDDVSLVEAYAACGGYPQHLAAWDVAKSTDENLRRLAGTSGGLLLEDAPQIVHEEVGASTGSERILGAIGRGANKFSTLTSEAGQRIEVPLNLLVRIGLVRSEVPVGAPKGSRPLYRIDDPYLGLWFSVLYEGRAYAEATGGAPVATHPRWSTHVASVFEELARRHARLLVAAGVLEAEQVGRWWTQRGTPMELDVAGWSSGGMRFIGEARWADLDDRDMDRLARRLRDAARRMPTDRAPVLLAWARRFPAEVPDDVQCLTTADMVQQSLL